MSKKAASAQSSGRAATKTPAKPRGRPFKKGKSGNPGGRKPVPKDIKEAFRDLTPKAIKTLEDALKEGGSVAVRAAETILERAWGRAPQSLELSGPDGAPLPTASAAVVVLPAEQLPGALPPPAPSLTIEAQPLPQLEQPKAEE